MLPSLLQEVRDGFFQVGACTVCIGNHAATPEGSGSFRVASAWCFHTPSRVAPRSGTVALDIAMRGVGVAGKVRLLFAARSSLWPYDSPQVAVIPSNTFFATQVAASNAGAVLEP